MDMKLNNQQNLKRLRNTHINRILIGISNLEIEFPSIPHCRNEAFKGNEYPQLSTIIDIIMIIRIIQLQNIEGPHEIQLVHPISAQEDQNLKIADSLQT